MKRNPLTVTALAVLVALATPQAGAQGYSKTFSASAAQNPGIVAQLCQNDMMIVTAPGPIKSIGVTMPDSVESAFDGALAILRGGSATGRVPVIILLKDSSSIIRMTLSGCPQRGTSTLITVVNDAPALPSAKEFTGVVSEPTLPRPAATRTAAAAPISSVTATAPGPINAPISSAAVNAATTLNPAGALTGEGNITLPAPPNVTIELSRTSTGLTINIANGTSKTLDMKADMLTVMVGGQAMNVSQDVGGKLAPGLAGAYPVAVPGNLTGTDIQVAWTAVVPDLKAQFTLQASAN